MSGKVQEQIECVLTLDNGTVKRWQVPREAERTIRRMYAGRPEEKRLLIRPLTEKSQAEMDALVKEVTAKHKPPGQTALEKVQQQSKQFKTHNGNTSKHS